MNKSVYQIWCGNLDRAQKELTALGRYRHTCFKIPSNEDEAVMIFETKEVITNILDLIENRYLPFLQQASITEKEVLDNMKADNKSEKDIGIQQCLSDLQTHLYEYHMGRYLELKKYLVTKN